MKKPKIFVGNQRKKIKDITETCLTGNDQILLHS